MYDTEKRVAIVKKRIAEHRRRQARRSIRSLSADVYAGRGDHGRLYAAA